jgi:hypothetical protein
MMCPTGFSYKLVCVLGVVAATLAPSLAAPKPAAPGPTVAATQGKSGNGTIQSTQPLGVWTAPVDLGVVSIHQAMLHTGKVLVWGAPSYGQIGTNTVAKLLDPVTGIITDVTVPFPGDIICAGQTILPDGRVITDGGNDVVLGHGIVLTTLFDPISETWSQTGNMTYARWYPTNIQMPDGSAIVLSGLDQNHVNLQRIMESYNATTGTWTSLPASAELPDTRPGYTYQHTFLLPNGKVMEAGPWRTTNLYDPVAQTWSKIGNMEFGDRYHAAAVLLPNSSTVLIAGGTPVNVEGSSTATATVETIDLSQTSPAWQYVPSMNLARYNENLVYLADGTILAVGGGTGPTKYANPVYQAEIYDPVAQSWTLMAAQQGNRTYHSNAELLPDGRVISSGSTNGSTNAKTYEIFSPPYLFKGARPTVTGGPSAVHYGKQFSVATTNTDITKVALIKASANTHAVDMDQRYVTMTFTQGSGKLIVTAPPDSNTAPPGYYMLVIVNSNGVPSKMRFVQVGS